MSDDNRIAALEERIAAMTADMFERIAAVERDRWDKAESETRKRDFIRNAAVAIYVQGMMVNDRAPGVVTFQPATCWRAASELWDAKPEDC